MFTKVLLTCFIVLSITSCASSDACLEDVTRDTFTITLTKGACFGLCPVYDGTVNGDGSIAYEGRVNTDRMGTYTGQLDKEDLCNILTAIVDNQVMRVDTNHLEPVQDAPMTTLTLTFQGNTRHIRWNLGAPPELKDLQKMMVAATHDNMDLKAVQR